MRADRLRGEELMAEVHVVRLVPIFGRHLVDNMAVVVGSVVDEHADGTDFRPDSRDRGSQRGDVGNVAMEEARAVFGAIQALGESLRGRVLDVDEGDAGIVLSERRDDGRTDAGAAAGDERNAIGETGITGKAHQISLGGSCDAGPGARGEKRGARYSLLSFLSALFFRSR